MRVGKLGLISAVLMVPPMTLRCEVQPALIATAEMTSDWKSSWRRVLRCLGFTVFQFEHDPHAGGCVQVAGMSRIGFKFLPDPVDEHAQVVRTVDPPRSPDLFKNLLARDDVARLAKKNLDHSKLDASQIDLRTVGVKGSPRRDVNRKIVCHDGRRVLTSAYP